MIEKIISDEMIKFGDRIAVGVSGGADSMLLLWALMFKQRDVDFYMKVVCVNHHLRGEESDRDSKFVEEFCKKKKIPYEIVHVDVIKFQQKTKGTIEECARTLRYDAINSVMKKDKLDKLFLAHHKNDQAETILMHIFRGSGILGACGMRQNGNIIRPLLCFDKKTILQMVKDYGINYVQDSTNLDNNYSRNYIRNVVIPEIEKIYPKVVDSIFSFGQKCEEIQSYVESNINLNLIEKDKDSVLLKGQICDYPSFLQREYIRQAFLHLNISSDIESKHYELISNLFDSEVNSTLDLPHKIKAMKTYKGIKIFKQNSKIKSDEIYEFKLGETQILNTKISACLISSDEVVYGDGTLYVDLAKIPLHAVWRTRRDGDKISKLGTGSKKLNDYFTDKKINIDERDLIPVLAVKNKILVVAGQDISENVKIDSSTEQIVKLSFMKVSILDSHEEKKYNKNKEKEDV